MNIDAAFAILRREHLLLDNAPHSAQFQDLIAGLCGSEALPLICDVCRHHHERWDGSGYPDRLAGADITPWVQVVGMADAFDTLIHPRVYKPAFSQQQAAAMVVDGACGAFAPAMLVCFRENIGPICRRVYG